MTNQACEVVMVVDSAGDYAVGKDLESAIEAYENEVQSIAESGGYRVVNLTLNVALPESVELSADVPNDVSQGAVSFADVQAHAWDLTAPPVAQPFKADRAVCEDDKTDCPSF